MKINIHLDDSLKAMESMPDKKYGLAICDPEYGINAGNKKRYHKKGFQTYHVKKWDTKAINQLFLNEIIRVSSDQILFGWNYYSNLLPRCKKPIIWDKMQPEGIDQAMFECMYNSQEKIQAKIYRQSAQSNSNKATNKYSAKKYERIHQTQKPIKLYKWLLKNYAFNKDGSKRTIFDSHGGSLSIVIACIDMGFDIDIWEIDPDYYRDGVNRVKKHLAQLDLTRETVEINIK